MALIDEIDPDRSAVVAIQQQDRRAFEDFMRRQERWVRGVVFAVLGNRDRVDDVAQNVWLAVWTRAGELRDVRRWRSWLYRLARNAAIDAGRAVTRSRQLTGPIPDNLPDKTGPIPLPQGRDEGHQAILRAIEALPALYREPFVLKHLNGWSYRKIAEVMAMPVDSVETRLVRARRLLRGSLKDKLDENHATLQ